MPILPGLIANSGGSQPSPPTGLFSSATTINSFTLNWTPPEFLGKLTPVRYVISLYDSSGSLINLSHRTVNYPANTFVVDGLAEGTTYSVRMRLENSSGIFSELSAPSANITTAVTPPPPPPEPPPSVTTWFCTINSVGAGVSSYPSNQNETGAICNSYAISCSTSGYPGAPSIPACPVDPPPGEPTCTARCGPYTAYGSCQILYSTGGLRYRTRTCTRANCTTYTETDSTVCCIATCGAWSSWSGGQGGQSRTRTCQRSDCSTYTETETRCGVRTTTSCGSCSRTRPFRRTCTVTTTNADCTTSRSSYSESC
jgi:hypothetical protein